MVAKTSEYLQVWNTLKATGYASIVVSTGALKRVTVRILQIKAEENVARRLNGKMYYSKLVIKRTPISDTHIKVEFSFLYPRKL